MKPERRRFKRRAILESFSIFVAINAKGAHRLVVHDLSDIGIGFDFDIEGESLSEKPVSPGESIELKLYLNQTLFVPLQVSIARVEIRNSVRRIGAQFVAQESPEYEAYLSFLRLIDALTESAALDKPPLA